MRRKPVEQRRKELIAAATAVIGEVGIEGATTRVIVARAGMSLASFHYAFESRDALFAACITVLIDQEAEVFADFHVGSADPAVVATTALERFASWTRTRWRLHRAHYELSFHAQQHPDLVEVVARYRRQATDLVARLLAELRPDWPQDHPVVIDLVTLVLVITDGMTAAYIRFQDDAELDRAVRIGAAAVVAAVERASQELGVTG